jgi:hypothetical protein
MSEGPDEQRHVILDPADPADAETLQTLRSDARVTVLDHHAAQRAQLLALRPAVSPELADEPMRWVYTRAPLGGVRAPATRFRACAGPQPHLIPRQRNGAGLGNRVRHQCRLIIAHTLAIPGLWRRTAAGRFRQMELGVEPEPVRPPCSTSASTRQWWRPRIAELDPIWCPRARGGHHPAALDTSSTDTDIVVEERAFAGHEGAVCGKPPQQADSGVMPPRRGPGRRERFDQHPDRPTLHGLFSEVVCGVAALDDSRTRSRTSCAT